VRRWTTYGVRLGAGSARVAADLGVLDAAGRLHDGAPPDLTGPRATAYVRGALLAAGSISAPGRDAHLEIGCGSAKLARVLATLIEQVIGGGAHASDGERPRVVVKSGARIGDLLAATGATRAFLAWDERRLRRQLRGEANRLANADAANLRRTIEAASSQVRAVEQVVERIGWDALDDELREVALARLANPSASLSELGQLVSPAIGKSAVHRRLRRLEQLAAEGPDDAPDPAR
jgi:cell division protein WhiA